MFNKNEHHEIELHDLGKQGEGIGQIDGFTFFVSGALPSDVIEMRIVKLKKNYGYGKLIRVIKPSPFRAEPECPVAAKCGGCSLQHMEYGAQLKFKSKIVRDNIERIGGIKDIVIEDIIGMDAPYRYRNKAQFPVREVSGEASAGFFSAASHNIIPVGDCCIQHEMNAEIISALKAFMAEHGVSAYDERLNTGIIRHLVTRVARQTGEIMVCLVINSNSLPYHEAFVNRLKNLNGITGITININRKQSNVIFGDTTKTLWGRPCITDFICGLKFNISPVSFFQVNPVQTEVLYKKALELAGAGKEDTVIDAYCGVGTISLFFARYVKKVYGIEIVPQAVNDARGNALLNNIDNAEFLEGATEELLPSLLSRVPADLIIVDPPRKGCAQSLLSALNRSGIRKILYISCDPSTLARDLKDLCADYYKVENVAVVDMFPHTTHVEVCCCLRHV